jgi:hypothetical protein
MQTTISIAGMAAHQYSSLMATLPITPTSWIPTTFVIVLTVAIIAGLVYALSGLIKSETAEAWSRFQIYEAFLSILLLLAFGSIAYVFFLNPQPVFSKAGLVPSTCTSASQLYTLAACDISLFNNATFTLARYLVYADYLVSFISGIPPKFTVNPIPLNPYISVGISPPSLLPSDATTLMTYMYDLMLFMLIFNQIQLIVISGSVLFLAFFLSLGLVARTLGFLRTFGGAMIAFGLGIGIVYPLLVSMTYGYIDVVANLSCLQSTTCAFTSALSAIFTLVFSVSTTLSLSAIPAALGTLFTYVGHIFIGLTIIPILNLTIVDAFVIDFSKSLGQQISFGELFSRFI